jgi:hypothetical protein
LPDVPGDSDDEQQDELGVEEDEGFFAESPTLTRLRWRKSLLTKIRK